MQKQQDPLNLQSLPLISPPSDLWPGVEAELLRTGRRRAAARYAGGALALAAALVLALGLVLRAPPGGPAVQPEQLASSAQETPPAVPPKDAQSLSEANLEAVIALSQRLEGRLRRISAEAGSLPARAVVYQVELEDLVVQVDEELSRSPESLPLWTQRVDLLVDLERLYESGLRREYQEMASL
jgi:hypothetical protein